MENNPSSVSDAVPAKYSDALRGIMNREFIATPKYQEQQWRANRDGAHPKILEFEKAMVKRMAQLGVPMFAHCVIRTPDEQDALYVTGKSNVRGDGVDRNGVPSPNGAYPHRFAAVELVHGLRGWDMPRKAWDLVGHVGFEVAKKLSIPIEWGGEWQFYDPAHWELAFWKGMNPEPPHMSIAADKIAGRRK